MNRVQLVNAAVADILKGAYVAARFTLPTLATETGINYRTLQRIMAGEAPVTVGQLEIIANAVNRDPQDLFEDALKKADRDGMSEAAATTDQLDTKRKQRQAAEMPDEALDDEMKKVATRDDELDTPEPDAP